MEAVLGFRDMLILDPPSQAPERGENWRASANVGGSPGADDPAVSHPLVVINEILAHTDLPLLDTNPGKARGQQYDLVLNNNEVGGGSIRIHDRQLQEKVFALIGLEPDVAQERFGHMLEAFEYGTPPHGGIAPGIDRVCMILADEPNIREVIAFPKNQAARDVMGNAPSPVEPEQLKELHIKLDLATETPY